MIEIKADVTEADRLKKYLESTPEKLARIRKAILKEGAKVASTGIARGVTKEYYVKYSVIRGVMYTEYTSESVVIRVRDKRHTLRSFYVRPSKAYKKRPKVSGYLKAGVKRGLIQNVSRGFVFPVNDLPVKRTGKGRHGTFEGLKVLIGPSLSQLAESKSVLPEVKEKAEKRMSEYAKYRIEKEMGIRR